MLEAALLSSVTGLLWVLSVSSWIVILYKTWWVWRVGRDVPLAQQAFWQAADAVQACHALALLDRQAVLLPLVQQAYPSTLLGGSDDADMPTADERLRGVLWSLRPVTRQIRWGQAWLACVAAAAPFVGLLGTVWGLMDALGSLTQVDEVAWGTWVPVLSQVLSLTGAGLVVALPALLAHQLLAPSLDALQQTLEDFAADLMAQVPA